MIIKNLPNATLLIFMLFGSSGCKKECDCENLNRLEFAENTIGLNKAILENWGVHTIDEPYEGYRLIVGVFSPEVIIHHEDSDVDSLSGLGHGIQFELFSEKPIDFGITQFTGSADHIIGTFSFGLVYHDFRFNYDDWLDEEFIASGDLSLQVMGNELILEFTGILESGELVTASYTGEFIYRVILI